MEPTSVQIVTLTVNQLQEVVQAASERAVEKFLLRSPSKPVEAEVIYLDADEAGQLLRVCRQTICDWAKKGKLPSYHIDRLTYYKRHEVLALPQPKARATGRRQTQQRAR